MKLQHAVAVVGTALVALAGCTTTDPVPGAPPEAPNSAPATSPAASADSPAPTSNLRLGERFDGALVDVLEPRILVTSARGLGLLQAGYDALTWWDLELPATGVTMEPEPGWTIQAAAANDRFVVWVEDTFDADAPDDDVSWRMSARDLYREVTTVLDESLEPAALTPSPAAFGDVLLYTVPSGADPGYDLVKHDLVTGEREVLVTGEYIGSPVWDGDRVLVVQWEDVEDESIGSVRVLADDGALVPVPGPGDTDGVEFAGGHLLWHEASLATDGTDGPTSVWVRSWPADGEPVLVAEGQYVTAELGDGFAVVHDAVEAKAFVVDLEDPSHSLELTAPGDAPMHGRPWVAGDLVVWLTGEIGGDGSVQDPWLHRQLVERSAG